MQDHLKEVIDLARLRFDRIEGAGAFEAMIAKCAVRSGIEPTPEGNAVRDALAHARQDVQDVLSVMGSPSDRAGEGPGGRTSLDPDAQLPRVRVGHARPGDAPRVTGSDLAGLAVSKLMETLGAQGSPPTSVTVSKLSGGGIRSHADASVDASYARVKARHALDVSDVSEVAVATILSLRSGYRETHAPRIMSQLGMTNVPDPLIVSVSGDGAGDLVVLACSLRDPHACCHLRDADIDMVQQAYERMA